MKLQQNLPHYKEALERVQGDKQWVESVKAGLNSPMNNPPPSSALESQVIQHNKTPNNFSHRNPPTEGEPARWEALHTLSRVQQETRSLVLQERRRQEEREFAECTFQPRILETSARLAEKTGDNIFRRAEQWAHNKDSKRKQLEEIKAEKQLVDCTFRPQTTPSTQRPAHDQPEKGKPGSKSGVDKFLDRQQQARAEKERVNAILTGNTSANANAKGQRGGPKSAKAGYAEKYFASLEPSFKQAFGDAGKGSLEEASLALHKLLNGLEVDF